MNFPTLTTLIALVIGLVGAPFVIAEGLSPDGLEALQRFYIRQQGQNLDTLARQLLATPDTVSADRSFTTHSLPSPRGSSLVFLLSRPTTDHHEQWLILVLDPRTFTITMVFDFLNALGLEDMIWLDEHRFVLHARAESLAGPPGPLWYINLRTHEARRLVDLAWRLAVSPHGDAILVENQDDPDEPYAERSLFHVCLSSSTKDLIKQVTHPTKQFGSIGPFDPESGLAAFSIDEYGTDGFIPTRHDLLFDPLSGRAFPAEEDSSPKQDDLEEAADS